MDEKGVVHSPTATKTYGSDHAEIDPVKERKLVRKLDLCIVPVVMLLYLLSFLDRVCQA